MEINQTPRYDASENPTGCCPKFNYVDWDNQTLAFSDKPFVKVKTRSVMHVPLNMEEVFAQTLQTLETEGVLDVDQNVVLSRDLSAWSTEHLFAVTRPVLGQRMVSLSGEFRTKVFEGSFKNAHKWGEQFEEDLEESGFDVDEIYFFYPTCPKCAKTYGENYVVAVAKTESEHD